MIAEVNNTKTWDKKWFDKMTKVIDLEKPVQVYRNLHKNCWSVRQCGKVKAHTNYLCLQDVEFVVQHAGREKVLREKKKNVHAFVKGFLISGRECDKITEEIDWTQTVVNYNPYKEPHFMAGDWLVDTAVAVDMDITSVDTILAWGIKPIQQFDNDDNYVKMMFYNTLKGSESYED